LVARVFHRLLALLFLNAFLSLGAQVDVLIGSRGLLPIAPMLEALRQRPEIGLFDFPTLFWWNASDALIQGGIWIGVLLALVALAGFGPRLCFLLLVPLYLSYSVACREFLSFQWDNLLLECGFLAIFLPRDRPERWIHLAFRVLLFKLYWESGIAKWQSHLHDWQDGSAMTFYYETAPLPTWLGWYAHHLPSWWHELESRAVLVLELIIPLAIFGPRLARLSTCLVFTGFQILNLLTANYGFFCYGALALHVFLLDDRDLTRLHDALQNRLGRFWRKPSQPAHKKSLMRPRALHILTRFGPPLLCTLYIGSSSIEGYRRFVDAPRFREAVAPVRRLYSSLRLVNTYHLFGHITRVRIEPEFQTLQGEIWSPHHMHYKPGPIDRPPPFVAPHQPRVDFRLWFYGLGYRRGVPQYTRTLLDRLCHDPKAVQALFIDELPPSPEAVRIVFSRYQFSSPDAPQTSDAYWSRTFITATSPIRCKIEAR